MTLDWCFEQLSMVLASLSWPNQMFLDTFPKELFSVCFRIGASLIPASSFTIRTVGSKRVPWQL
jgi:hypothetical protein